MSCLKCYNVFLLFVFFGLQSDLMDGSTMDVSEQGLKIYMVVTKRSLGT